MLKIVFIVINLLLGNESDKSLNQVSLTLFCHCQYLHFKRSIIIEKLFRNSKANIVLQLGDKHVHPLKCIILLMCPSTLNALVITTALDWPEA